MSNDIMVTVCSFCYNHEKYLRKALEGFVMQKTNFRFEVIIHDDASTDSSAEIIREYAKKYDFIRPIFQNENQYSKGIDIGDEFILPKARGKYIAYCEGDDYWCDELKLQKQYEFMEKNPSYTMCCHAYKNVVANTEKVIKNIYTLQTTGDITPEIAILYHNPSQLATQFFVKSVVTNMPQIYKGYGVADYMLLLNAVANGKVHYSSEIMAVHRVASDGSWTQRVYNNISGRISHNKAMIEFLSNYDIYYEGKYHLAVEKRIDEFVFDIAYAEKNMKKVKTTSYYKDLPIRERVILYINCKWPFLIEVIKKILIKRKN